MAARSLQIDGTAKDPGGDLPREVAIQLGQLPGEQGKLSDEAGRSAGKLETLGSIVYVWANKDIVRSMNEVKDDLAKPQTGKPTQLEEQRIEEQIQAMIDNLAQHQKNQEFANRNNGGRWRQWLQDAEDADRSGASAPQGPAAGGQ